MYKYSYLLFTSIIITNFGVFSLEDTKLFVFSEIQLVTPVSNVSSLRVILDPYKTSCIELTANPNSKVWVKSNTIYIPNAVMKASTGKHLPEIMLPIG